jgi:seryl-tRNA synthetase
LVVLGLRLIRDNLELVNDAMARRGFAAPIGEIVRLDDERRRLLQEVESLKAKRNEASRQIAAMEDSSAAEALKAEMRRVGERIKALDVETAAVEEKLNALLLEVPNLPHASVPIGKDERENVVVRTWGRPRGLDFEPLPHWEIGERLGIIDFERGVKMSGTRFYLLRGLGARLQRALITWMLDLHVNEHGYQEIYPPFVVKEECLVGAAQLPKFRDNLYHDVEDDVWMVPTAEVPLTNLHRDEILDTTALPRRYVAYTPCFRREKMSAGRDVRGIKRGHQFDKVEMYKFTRPQDSYHELEKLVDNAEEVCRRLEIAYRVVEVCTGDLGFSTTKTYDVEMWAPGCGEWLEVSSCSNCEEFQARRANTRYRPTPTARPEFVHTLNGSGLALPRTVIAVLENYQQADGSVLVPEVLRPYMGDVRVIR